MPPPESEHSFRLTLSQPQRGLESFSMLKSRVPGVIIRINIFLYLYFGQLWWDFMPGCRLASSCGKCLWILSAKDRKSSNFVTFSPTLLKVLSTCSVAKWVRKVRLSSFATKSSSARCWKFECFIQKKVRDLSYSYFRQETTRHDTI